MTEMLTVNDDNSNGLNKGTADDDIGTHAIRMAPHVSTWELTDKCVFLLLPSAGRPTQSLLFTAVMRSLLHRPHF